MEEKKEKAAFLQKTFYDKLFCFITSGCLHLTSQPRENLTGNRLEYNSVINISLPLSA